MTPESRKLASFPIVCLPDALARLPEYYPLLAHEVGHAVDNALGLCAQVNSELSGEYVSLWQAWMHEIIADVIGVVLAGRAFLIALEDFIEFQPVEIQNKASSRYPGKALRLALVREMVTALGGAAQRVDPFTPGSLGQEDEQLLKDFQQHVWSTVQRVCVPDELSRRWSHDEERVDRFAEHLIESHLRGIQLNDLPEISFRRIPSGIALAQKRLPADSEPFDTLALFRRLHGQVKTRPQWVREPYHWRFVTEVLNALRLRILGIDGKSKVPPVELMKEHQTLIFVGATHRSLKTQLTAALADGAKWSGSKSSLLRPNYLSRLSIMKKRQREKANAVA